MNEQTVYILLAFGSIVLIHFILLIYTLIKIQIISNEYRHDTRVLINATKENIGELLTETKEREANNNHYLSKVISDIERITSKQTSIKDRQLDNYTVLKQKAEAIESTSAHVRDRISVIQEAITFNNQIAKDNSDTFYETMSKVSSRINDLIQSQRGMTEAVTLNNSDYRNKAEELHRDIVKLQERLKD